MGAEASGNSARIGVAGGAHLFLGVALLVTGCTGNPPPPPVPLATPVAALTATPAPTPTPLLVRPAPSPTPSELLVTLDEAILTERLNRELAGRWQLQTTLGAATVRNLRVGIGDGRLHVSGDAQTDFFSLPLAVATTVEARAGRPIVRVLEAQVGGVALPEEARQQIELTLQAAVDQAVDRERFEVRTLEVGEGVLTVRGRRTP